MFSFLLMILKKYTLTSTAYWYKNIFLTIGRFRVPPYDPSPTKRVAIRKKLRFKGRFATIIVLKAQLHNKNIFMHKLNYYFSYQR